MRYFLTYQSPTGIIQLESDHQSLISLSFNPQKPKQSENIPEILHEAARWLDLYFKGENPGTPPTLNPQGTEFQLRVWKELTKLGSGELITYGELAKRIKSHPRPVGQAVGRNPLPVFIPYHRIVASNGLGGYTPGVEIKKILLKIENRSERNL